MASLAKPQPPLRTNEGVYIVVDNDVIISSANGSSSVRMLFPGKKQDWLANCGVIGMSWPPKMSMGPKGRIRATTGGKARLEFSNDCCFSL